MGDTIGMILLVRRWMPVAPSILALSRTSSLIPRRPDSRKMKLYPTFAQIWMNMIAASAVFGSVSHETLVPKSLFTIPIDGLNASWKIIATTETEIAIDMEYIASYNEDVLVRFLASSASPNPTTMLTGTVTTTKTSVLPMDWMNFSSPRTLI